MRTGERSGPARTHREVEKRSMGRHVPSGHARARALPRTWASPTPGDAVHDPLLKSVFADRGMIEILIRDHVRERAGETDFSTLRQEPAELVSGKTLQRRHPDMIWSGRPTPSTEGESCSWSSSSEGPNGSCRRARPPTPRWR